jgi:hypothetical protein
VETTAVGSNAPASTDQPQPHALNGDWNLNFAYFDTFGPVSGAPEKIIAGGSFQSDHCFVYFVGRNPG